VNDTDTPTIDGSPFASRSRFFARFHMNPLVLLIACSNKSADPKLEKDLAELQKIEAKAKNLEAEVRAATNEMRVGFERVAGLQQQLRDVQHQIDGAVAEMLKATSDSERARARAQIAGLSGKAGVLTAQLAVAEQAVATSLDPDAALGSGEAATKVRELKTKLQALNDRRGTELLELAKAQNAADVSAAKAKLSTIDQEDAELQSQLEATRAQAKRDASKP
jgi:hypothetical protein